MKTFNIRPLIFTIVFGSSATTLSIAQQTDLKYIEVTVSDSSEINPDIIEYNLKVSSSIQAEAVYPGQNDDFSDTNTDYALDAKKKQEEQKIKMKLSEKKIIELLEKEKINYSRRDEKSYIYNPYDYNDQNVMKSFVIIFKSFDQMDKFLEKIPEDVKFDGHVSNLMSSKYRDAEDMVMERALVSARKKAENIAHLSGVNLGKVIQFSDNEGDNLVKGLERLIYSIPRMYEADKYFRNTRKIIVMKTVRVRFGIE